MSFPTFLMSFAASHSGCQVLLHMKTLGWATPAHTGNAGTDWNQQHLARILDAVRKAVDEVSCLCFVSTQRTRQASCCTSGRIGWNFALTWIAFVFGSKTWLEKWQLSHGFAVDGAYFLGFSTFLSEKCNCHTVSLWGSIFSRHVGILRQWGWKLGSLRSCPPRLGLSENCFSVSSVQERIVLLASQLLPSTLIGSNNVKLRGW